MFHSYFRKKKENVLIFTNVYFPVFEIGTALNSFKI